VAIIYLDRPLPTGSPAETGRDLPAGRTTRRPFTPGPGATEVDRLLGLAGGGVYPADDVAAVAVRSYRTFSPLPVPRRAIGRVFSVALSLGSPPVAV